MRRFWKHVRYRLEWLLINALVRLVPLLPRRLCFSLALWGGATAALLDRRNFKVATENLRLAFGDRYSPNDRKRLARESYQHFARTMLDLFWSPGLTRNNWRDYIETENLEYWQAQVARGEPFILCCYHYSNFEWLSLAGGFLGYPSSIIAQQFKNPLLDPIFRRLREQSGHRMVDKRGAIIQLFKTLERKGSVAILIDLTLHPRIPTVAVECFGMKTSMTFAHAWLHQRTGAPLVTAHCEPLPGGRYRLMFHEKLRLPPGASTHQIAQACWDQFEPYVRRNPAPWLWMYKHWRYKPINAGREYPFYANESPWFEQRLAGRGVEELLTKQRECASE
jgi:lauroyl/myristoyl acyltransferase